MKNLFFLLLSLFYYSQCTIKDLNLNLMHMNEQYLNNFIYSDLRVTEIRNSDKYFHVERNEFIDYLNETHKVKNTDFTFRLEKCLTNKSKLADYTVSFIDGRIYKIRIKVLYDLNEVKNIENDYIKIKSIITNTYKINRGMGTMSYKFSGNQSRVTGKFESFDYKINTPLKILEDGNRIWKVNDVSISKNKNYEVDFKNMVHTDNLLNYEMEIEFTNLYDTPLDNRGY